MGGPATLGLTKLWRKATERVPVPCRMCHPLASKLCNPSHQMALLLLGSAYTMSWTTLLHFMP